MIGGVVQSAGRVGSNAVPEEKPSYLRISAAICHDIRIGVYKVGDQIPSYHELMDKYDVSESTIQRVMIRLKAQDVLRGQHGKGTFVNRVPADGDDC